MQPTVTGRRGVWIRTGLLALAIGQGGAAAWALFAPRSWFAEFPGGGQHWVAAYPPFNEHLATDYGGAFIALSLLVAIAGVLLERRLVVIAMVCWLTAAVPHLIFHIGTRDAYQGAERVASLTSLVLTVVIPIAILAGVRRAGAPSPSTAPASG
jgi:uncharacterized membrane protein